MVKIKSSLDVLTYLVTLLGVGPLFLWLDTSVKFVVIGAFIGGIVCDKRQYYWFGSRLATAFTILFFVLYSAQINFNNVIPPAINLLALLLSIRLLTEKQGRHYLQIFVLSLFCLAGSSLLSLNITYLPALILMVAAVTIGLVLLTFFHRDPSLRLDRQQLFTLLKTASILPIGSLLLMLVLFVVLPRTQYPLWNFLNPKSTAKTGFSEQVRPGAFASNNADKSLAFRVKSPEIAQENLYWRGTVMNTIEGKVWKRVSPQNERVKIVGGESIDYTVTLPPTNERFLFTLDQPVSLEGVRHREEGDHVYMAHRRLEKSLTYNGRSRIGGQLQQDSDLDSDLYLSVPTTLSARIHQVARQIRLQADSPMQRIILLQEFFKAQQLSYAISDLPGPAAPIDEFLFSKKRGYCEFFATSFATLLRLSGIPARLVGGYQGGEYNNLGGYYLVTEDLAHVWVEALIDGRWQRIDPSRLAINASSALLAPRRQGLSFLKRAMDSAEYMWAQLVINYDLQQQIKLLHQGGHQLKNILPRLATLKISALLLGVCLPLTVLLIWWWRQHGRSSESRLLLRYQTAISKSYDLKKIPKNCGLLELAQQLGDPHAIVFAQRFNAVLYGDQPLTDDEIIALTLLIDAIGKTAEEK